MCSPLFLCFSIQMRVCQSENMRALGLKVIAINSITRAEAKQRRNEDLWEVARTKPNVTLAGPEQLKSADFEKAFRDDDFYDRICGTGFDEVHLLKGCKFPQGLSTSRFCKGSNERHA